MRQMVVGEPSNQPSERVRQLAGWWNACGFEVRVSESIRTDIWWKLTGNLSFNTVSALTGYRTDQLIDDAALVELLCAMIDETKAVAAAYGVTVEGDARQRIERARVIGRARSSTLQDFEAGRRPQIEGHVGSLIE